MKNDRPSIYAKSRQHWRTWLSKNSHKKQFVWLILYHKKSGKPSVDYNDAVEEAICVGWIDSKPNKRDTESYYLFFARRKPASNWSEINRNRANKMIKARKMKAAGKKMIDLAKKTGTWTALKEVQKLALPADLKKLFSKNKLAKKNFNSFPPSSKRGILEWLLNAKTSATREKRNREIVRLAAVNIRANHYPK